MFLLNDLSISDSYDDAYEFKTRLDVVMNIKNILRKHGHDVLCKSDLMSINLFKDNGINLFKFSNEHLSRDQRLALIAWLTERGPFWSENRFHSEDDYYSVNEDVVTDTSLAEAAARQFRGNSSVLISFLCEKWGTPKVDVKFISEIREITTSINNYLNERQVLDDLPSFDKPISSWVDLEKHCRDKYSNLSFLDGAFTAIYKQPYSNAVVNMTLELLELLDIMKTCFTQDGARNEQGNELYQKHFTGDKAWFSDSSDREKNSFEAELTFRGIDGRDIFCPWHGKIKTPQFRIHFSWPIAADRDLYIAYIGPKITKK